MPAVNVNHVDQCDCYLQGDRPVIVAPCYQPADENTCDDCGEYIDDHDLRAYKCDVQS